MKPKNREKKLNSRRQDYDKSGLSSKSGYKKPGSNKK